MSFGFTYSNDNGNEDGRFFIDGKEYGVNDLPKDFQGMFKNIFKNLDEIKSPFFKGYKPNFYFKLPNTKDFIESINEIAKESCGNSCKCEEKNVEKRIKTKGLNIYEARTYLKNAPKDTRMIVHIEGKEFIVSLDEYGVMICYTIDGNDLGTLFSNFDDEDILFAKFDIIEEKEEWFDCNVKEAVEKIKNGETDKVRWEALDGTYGESCNAEDFDVDNLTYNDIINCKWQYLKKN